MTAAAGMGAGDREERRAAGGPEAGPVVDVVGIAGSLRRESYNRALLEAAVEAAPEGLRVSVFDRLGEIPLYDADLEAEGDPASVTALKQVIAASEAVLWVTPEYNYSVPGVLKNAFDWASRPARDSVLIGKPMAVTGASPGPFGTSRAQMALRQSMVFTRSPVLPGPELLVSRAAERFDDQLRLVDDKVRDRLVDFLVRLRDWVRTFRGAPVDPRR